MPVRTNDHMTEDEAELRDAQIVIAALVNREGGQVELSQRELVEADGEITTWQTPEDNTVSVRVDR